MNDHLGTRASLPADESWTTCDWRAAAAVGGAQVLARAEEFVPAMLTELSSYGWLTPEVSADLDAAVFPGTNPLGRILQVAQYAAMLDTVPAERRRDVLVAIANRETLPADVPSSYARVLRPA